MSWPDTMNDGWRLAGLAHPACAASCPDAPAPPEDARAFAAKVAPQLRAAPSASHIRRAPAAVQTLLSGAGSVRRQFQPAPGLQRWLRRSLLADARDTATRDDRADEARGRRALARLPAELRAQLDPHHRDSADAGDAEPDPLLTALAKALLALDPAPLQGLGRWLGRMDKDLAPRAVVEIRALLAQEEEH